MTQDHCISASSAASFTSLSPSHSQFSGVNLQTASYGACFWSQHMPGCSIFGRWSHGIHTAGLLMGSEMWCRGEVAMLTAIPFLSNLNVQDWTSAQTDLEAWGHPHGPEPTHLGFSLWIDSVPLIWPIGTDGWGITGICHSPIPTKGEKTSLHL